MNNIEHNYLRLLKDILDNGVQKQDRTGTGTISVFGRQIRHKMSEGFPLLTTKKMPFKIMVTELLWFLRGDTNIKYLVDNNCHIWDGDAYKAYEKWYDTEVVNLPFDKPKRFTQEEFIKAISLDDDFAKRWGELGPIYGKQWRGWTSTKAVEFDEDTFVPIKYEDVRVNDQIQNLINDLKTNPDSRRLMVNAWNVGELDQMVLPPCHYGFQVYTRELNCEERKEILYNKFRKGPIIVNGESYIECAPTDINFEFFNIPTRAISLMWNQRSVDTFLGLPFNIASYGLLLEIIAREINMVPDELIGNLGDVHLYSNHIEQAKEQITREPMKLPTLGEIPDYLCMKDNWECYEPSDFTLENYESHPTIKAPLSN
jgi:thymidylate synthase